MRLTLFHLELRRITTVDKENSSTISPIPRGAENLQPLSRNYSLRPSIAQTPRIRLSPEIHGTSVKKKKNDHQPPLRRVQLGARRSLRRL